jgi:hypothetical protein
MFDIWIREPDDKSSKGTLAQIGVADFNDENAAAIPTVRSTKDSSRTSDVSLLRPKYLQPCTRSERDHPSPRHIAPCP